MDQRQTDVMAVTKEKTEQAWFQVEFLSSLEEGHWIPLYGRSVTIEQARDNRAGIVGYRGKEAGAWHTRIVRIERAVEVIE